MPRSRSGSNRFAVRAAVALVLTATALTSACVAGPGPGTRPGHPGGGAGSPGGPAAAGPVAPLSDEGRWLTDATGRVVLLHGINEVEKRPPYLSAATGFGADDAAFLADEG